MFLPNWSDVLLESSKLCTEEVSEELYVLMDKVLFIGPLILLAPAALLCKVLIKHESAAEVETHL